jgi:peptidoglycan/LPS O-acetylase OafA/YrhL
VLALFVLVPAYDSSWLLTIGLTLIAAMSAGLIGATLRTGSAAFRLFYRKPLRVLGKYSYGFYIFHVLFEMAWIQFFLVIFSKTHSLATAGIIALTTNFSVTFLVSKLSYDFYESRFLRFKKHLEYDSELADHTHAFVVK